MSRVLPILFNGDMVRAILDGRKTVTRRLIKPQPQGYFEVNAEPLYIYDTDFQQGRICPPYQPEDILYVRETWCDDRQFTHDDTPGIYFYKASESDDFTSKWHPSIHMPKEAARIWLKVKDIRVERLQEITEEQAKAEGAIDNRGFIHSPDNEYDQIHTAKEHFGEIWNSTIKKSDLDSYGWDANPWVWVIEFERCEKLDRI